MDAQVTGLNGALGRSWILTENRGSEMWVNNRCKRPTDGRVKDLPAEGGSACWNVRSAGKHNESDAGEDAGDISAGPGRPG